MVDSTPSPERSRLCPCPVIMAVDSWHGSGFMAAPIYAAFLGTWTLDPASCEYDQSEPPRHSTYRIEQVGASLTFTVHWVDAEDRQHRMSFSGVPNGERVPFDGGELADALSVSAVSERELNTSAFREGRELMVAQRQLDDTGQAMRITQVVRFVDGTFAANVGVYLKNPSA